MIKEGRFIFIVTIILVLASGIRLLPFYFSGEHPLGYDTGFYRRYIINPTVSFPNAPTEILGKSALGTRVFIDLLKLLLLPPDLILYGGYLLATVLVAAALFLFTRYLFGFSAGAITLFLFAISPVQYTTYWYFLWKNALGTALLFLAFLLIEKRSYWAMAPALLLMITHTTTAIIFLLSLALFSITSVLVNFTGHPPKNSPRRVFGWTYAASIAAVILLFIAVQWPISTDYFLNTKALFIDTKEYLRLSAFLFPLAAIGLYGYWPKIKHSILLLFAIVATAFPLLSLPFYQRIFPFLDLAIIILASLGIKTLFQTNLLLRWTIVQRNSKSFTEKIGRVIAALFIIWLLSATSIQTYNQIKNLQPLISEEILRNLKLISNLIPKNAAILTTTNFAPWVYGWSQNKIFAPGLINNFYSEEEWQNFWNTGDENQRMEFLNIYPKPLYFFIDGNSKSIFLPSEACGEKITEFIYKYKC